MLIQTKASGIYDHGLLSGLADDDHAQYVLANGTRQLTADWNAGPFRITAGNFEVTGTAGLVLPASTTYAFTTSVEPTTGLEFDTANFQFNFVRQGDVKAAVNAHSTRNYSFLALKNQALRIQDNSYAFVLASDIDTGFYFNNVGAQMEMRFGGSAIHSFVIAGASAGDYTANRDVIVGRALKLQSYSDTTRPSASSVGAGAMIFNTSDNFPNVSDGTNWRDMSGAIT